MKTTQDPKYTEIPVESKDENSQNPEEKPDDLRDSSKDIESTEQNTPLSSWEDFEEITGGSFNKLMGCGG